MGRVRDDVPRAAPGGPAEAQVPPVPSGAGIRAGAPLCDAGLVDVAATISPLLGAQPPSTSVGNVMRGVIERH
ncbi:hypothetical protein ACQEVZ_07315 [Dactylosporangium sp. CA-152071]|uniref:hypothetical protein n=1 Tax=Dactylosporangium sp. CA-152071 TaxID=3239933 RepID=UPI003D934E1F